MGLRLSCFRGDGGRARGRRCGLRPCRKCGGVRGMAGGFMGLGRRCSRGLRRGCGGRTFWFGRGIQAGFGRKFCRVRGSGAMWMDRLRGLDTGWTFVRTRRLLSGGRVTGIWLCPWPTMPLLRWDPICCATPRRGGLRLLEGQGTFIFSGFRGIEEWAGGTAYPTFCLDIGSSRWRLPVAAKTALVSAGMHGGTPGSPTPPGSASLSMMCTSVWTGAWFMRATG